MSKNSPFNYNATVSTGGGSGTPGGSNTQVQFNDAGSFGGDSGLTYNKTTNNLTTNSIFNGFTSVAASGTLITLTAASTPNYVVTGSGGQVIQLPDATTLPKDANIFSFNNNQTSGAITVNNNSSTLVASIPSGGYVSLSLLDNTLAAGSWDRHDQAPANVSWSTNTFDYAGSFTSGTWNGNTVQVNRGGTGAATLTGYVKGNGTAAMTAAGSVPVGDLSGLGTGIATALAINVGTAGAPVVQNGALGTPSSGIATNITGTASGLTAGNVTTNANLTGAVTSVGNATTVVTNANLTGDVTSVGNATTLTNAPVIAKVLTGYVSGAGVVAATDSILTAIQKLNGNDATNANLTGAVTSVGNATSLGSFTSAQLLAALTDETGTGTAVFSISPALTGTPTAPTAAAGTNTTQLATTAFVRAVLGGTSQVFTSAPGTYTTPANVKLIMVSLIGAGGGGAGSGTAPGVGGAGGPTTFGTALLTGSGGAANAGAGGAAAGGSVINIVGAIGNSPYSTSTTLIVSGASGASSYYAGGGSGVSAAAGNAAPVNSGAGGGGAGGGVGVAAAKGGSAGGYVEHIIVSPAATYAYAVGAAGTGGTAGTGGLAGGAGGSGVIIVEEFY